MSVDILIEKIKQKNNPSVLGLDPDLSYIPKYLIDKNVNAYGKTLKAAAQAALEFNMGLIDALCDIVPAIKPQSAYYELYGPEGVYALSRTIDYAKQKGMYVIADVKRNDIGSTASAYAAAYLGGIELDGQKLSAFSADAVTVNAYLGTDGIEPFLKECRKEKMIFALVKTSNPSSGELQDLKIEGQTVYSVVAGMVNKWAQTAMGSEKYSQVGAVVGATYPQQLLELRQKMPSVFFLVPGYGAQGAQAKDIAGAFDKDGIGAIINSSRGIMCAYKKGYEEKDFAFAARHEAIRMRDEILNIL